MLPDESRSSSGCSRTEGLGTGFCECYGFELNSEGFLSIKYGLFVPKFSSTIYD